MKYFIDAKEREESGSTCYLEWQKGYYHDECWLPDSINISGSLWDDALLTRFMRQVVKDFDYYDLNIVDRRQWVEIVRLSNEANHLCRSIIAEAIPWVEECFEEYDVFTICGL